MKLHIIDEAERCLKCKKPLVSKGCPIHTPIPQITQLLLENRLMEAGEILFANNPMSAVCSTVCNHENQCEGHCVLGRKSSPTILAVLRISFQILILTGWKCRK